MCLKNSKGSRVAGEKRERGRQDRGGQCCALHDSRRRNSHAPRCAMQNPVCSNPPGPGVGDEVREVLGSPVGQEKAFPLSEIGSRCQEGSEPEA